MTSVRRLLAALLVCVIPMTSFGFVFAKGDAEETALPDKMIYLNLDDMEKSTTDTTSGITVEGTSDTAVIRAKSNTYGLNITKGLLTTDSGMETDYIYLDNKGTWNWLDPNSFLYITDNALETTDNTISFWVDPNNLTKTENASYGIIVNYYINYDYNGTAEGRSLEIGEVGLESSKNYTWNTANELTDSIDMNNSKGWTHVAITNPVLDGGTKTMDVYINGVYKKSKALTVTEGATLTSAGIYFGGSATKPSYANRMKEANYGDLEVYTGVLSEEQIMKLYAETRGKYGIESPNDVAEGPGAVAPDAVSFDFSMKNDMDIDELDNVVLRRVKDNAEISAEFSAEGTLLTVTPKEYLSYGTDYILDFSPLYCADYEFTTAASNMGFAAEPSVSQDKIAFELATERSTGTVTVIAVGVDSHGALCGATSTVVDIANAKTGTLSESGMSDWNTVKLMIWENGDGYTMPLTEVIEIN